MKTPSSHEAAFGCLFFVLLIALSSVLNGLTLSVLWSWFVVERFGLPAIGAAQAIGLGLVLRMFLPTATPERKPKEGETIGSLCIQAAVVAVGLPASMLIAGWIVRHFV